MKEHERRLQKIEMAVAGSGIPKAEQVQVVVGRMEEGRFIPNDPKDSVEKRKESLFKRYGTIEGAIFIDLVDYHGRKGSAGKNTPAP
jgi:hypothetical protein